LCLPAIVKNATPEVTDRFQDGRRRHVGNSSECYKMGNYHPILMKIGTQTKKNMLSLKITKAEVQAKFQDGRRRHLEIEVRAIKWAITTRF
jgi:uncharacterized protein with von Willebrand factor type A (vWA) domain